MSNGYNVPLGIDLGDGLQKLDDLLKKAESLQKAAKETNEATSAMNKEIASGAEKASAAIQDEARAALLAKKAAEERVRAEKIAVQVMEDLAKRQSENNKLSAENSTLIQTYTKNLDYAKKALQSATDPTQVRVFAADMEKLRDKIVSVYDRAAGAIAPVNDRLRESGEMVDRLSDSVMGAFSDSEMEKLGNDINNAGNEMSQLGVIIDFISEKMVGMDPSDPLFKQLTEDIQTANEMLGRNAEAADLTTMSWDQLTDRLRFFQDSLKSEMNPQEIIRINQEIQNTEEQLKRIKNAGKEGFDELGNKLIPDAADKVKNLSTELQQTVQQMARLRMEGKVDTKEYQDLAKRANEIKLAMRDVNDELKKTASHTQGLDTLIESAKLVTAGFNVAQGAMALFGAESEEVEKITAKLAAGIAVLQGLQEIQVQLKNRESVANKVLTGTQAAYAFVVGTSTGALKLFRIALAATGIGLIILALGSLIANWDRLTSSIKISSPVAEKFGQTIDKIKAIAMGVGNAVLQWLIMPIKALYTLLTEGPGAAVDSFMNSMNVLKNYNEGFNWEIERQNNAAHLKKLEAQKKALEQEIEIRKAGGEDVKSQELALQSTILAIANATKEGQEEALHDFRVFEARINKERADEAKKAADEAKKLADKAAAERQKELERIKAFNRQLIDLEYRRQELAVEAMTDGVEKQKQAENLRYQQQLVSLDRELQDFKGTQEEKTRLEYAQQQIREQLLDDHISKLAAIDVVYFDDLVKSQAESNKLMMELNRQNQELEILEIENKFKAIADKYKEANGVEIDLTEEKQRAIDEVNTKYALEAAEKSESLALARLEQMKIEGKNEEEIAKLREMMKLSILIDGAQERLELLEKLGGAENEVEIENLRAFLAQANREIEGLSKQTEGRNIFQVLGLDVSKEEARMITDSWGNLFGTITNLWSEAISQQIELKNQQIQALNKQVGETERALDREIRLMEQGYANNVSAKKKELEELQAQRDKDVAQQQELQKKEQEMALVQIALNGIVQTSEMALAAAKIFKAHAGIPFAGVAIAAAAGLAMLATFVAIRNQIKSMQADVPKFGGGGEFVLNGPSHGQGGLGIYNEQTGERVAEAEGGEGFFFTNKRSTKKYRPVLEAINNDDLGAVSRFMDNLLEGTGVHRSVHDQTAKVVVLAEKKQSRDERYKDAMLAFSESESLRDIADSNRRMLDIERKRKKITETDTHVIEQQGNIIRRIKKKKD